MISNSDDLSETSSASTGSESPSYYSKSVTIYASIKAESVNFFNNDLSKVRILDKCLSKLIRLKYRNDSIPLDSFIKTDDLHILGDSKLKDIWDTMLLKLSSDDILDEIENDALELGFLELLIGFSIDKFLFSNLVHHDIRKRSHQAFTNEDLNYKLDLLLEKLNGVGLDDCEMMFEPNKDSESVLIDDDVDLQTIILDCYPDSFKRKTYNTTMPLIMKLSNKVKYYRLPDAELFEDYSRFFYEDGIKAKIFRQLTSANQIKSQLYLLHGEPGTGKTSLSRIMSNFVYSHLSDINSEGILVELSCSKLLSQFVNESEKNLDTLFDIFEEIARSGCYLFLLIDEVERLAMSRIGNTYTLQSEIKLTSTFLTCLDKIKKYEKIIVFTTTNLINELDDAFLDRVDHIYKLNQPTEKSTYQILRSTIEALISSRMVYIPGYTACQHFETFEWCTKRDLLNSSSPSILLCKVSKISYALKISGRALVKCCENCLIENCDFKHGNERGVEINRYLNDLLKCILNRSTNNRKVK
ncbi:hypothetical protein CANARDRAFT_20515 [[Candida] arabinofermentans NRRL YB-2248]|uniref:AAA+ ATPase domain-containing protein n=1 Tax=[Candida] arabinofermentans NRRL YB-2248 TaxID=983967 RepID=A0A1E4T7R6_9ASCO|nr:hypothetical protein CANARDRAFT_20515 [[Candida] arabinofermentans NRRL YB-2248]